jgi:hypothetical protein
MAWLTSLISSRISSFEEMVFVPPAATTTPFSGSPDCHQVSRFSQHIILTIASKADVENEDYW